MILTFKKFCVTLNAARLAQLIVHALLALSTSKALVDVASRRAVDGAESHANILSFIPANANTQQRKRFKGSAKKAQSKHRELPREISRYPPCRYFLNRLR